jgi:outer membrane protein OmpA-like peptidoglycan-associated protein
MKKNLLLSAFVMIIMLAFMPLHFYGQDKANEAKAKKTSVFDPYFHVFGEAGLSLFNGDLNMYGFLADPNHIKFNGDVGIGYQFTPVFGAFGKVGLGSFGGEKDAIKNGKVRNAMIDESKFLDFSLNASFNMVNLFAGYNPNRMFSFSTHIGFGQIDWKARAVDMTTKVAFDPEVGYGTNDIEKGWSGRANAWIVPVGAELTYRATEKLDIYADYTLNFSDSDRLDAFVDNSSDDRHWKEGTYKDDLYAQLNLGLRYKFISNSVKSMADNFGDVILEATPNPLEERGDSVLVTIKGTFPPKYFKKNAVINFTPVITYDGGSVALKPMNFKGENVTGDGVPVSYANGGTFTYTDKIPYHPNLNLSELVVAPLVYPAKSITNTTREAVTANEAYFTTPQRKLADGVIYTSKRIADKFKTSTAPHGYEKVTIQNQNASIYFVVNKHDLAMNLPLNKKEENIAALKAVTKNMEMGHAIKDITIAGWASPEGEETFNNGLSEKRAGTAIDYLNGEFKKMLKKKGNMLPIKDVKELNYAKSGNGPDWNGFMAAVEASSIKDKNAILNVVRSANPAQREQEIRNMILIYPELEKDILPPLRRAIINVNTFEPKKTDDEIANLSTTDPSKLSLNELLYAATLTEDLKTKQLVYASAMNLHPKCMRAVLNAAEVEINLGNTSTAKSLLEKALSMSDKSAAVYNNLAVVNVIERDFKSAEVNLNKAKELGSNVDYNTGVLNIYKGDYSKAVSLMNGEKCDYNLGLAQLLNKEYDAARNTLSCSPDNAQTSYLKAVLGARTGNNAEVYSNLMKAIKAHEGCKNTAKNDREFIKLFGEADFQAIVK